MGFASSTKESTKVAHCVQDLWTRFLHIQKFADTRPIFALTLRINFCAFIALVQSLPWCAWTAHSSSFLSCCKLIVEALQQDRLRNPHASFLLLSADLAPDELFDLTNIIAVELLHHALSLAINFAIGTTRHAVINPRYPQYQSSNGPLKIQARIGIALAIVHVRKSSPQFQPKTLCCLNRAIQSPQHQQHRVFSIEILKTLWDLHIDLPSLLKTSLQECAAHVKQLDCPTSHQR
mmetsp:Transcript_26145/g.38947  ORF Transcript_26145/g.38947 Transcript_26145/m.38947 type:complete len:235 (-) Transcript_26145:633-1337(-)